jgi:large subunit ribosomal protein L9
MKVILLANMDRLGKAGDIVDVAPGYGRNYLIPRGYAEFLTKTAKKQVESRKHSAAKKADIDLENAKELAKEIEDRSFDVKARVGARGKLYGAITTQAIAEAIGTAMGVKVDKRNITLLEQVKMLGGYPASLKLHPEVAVNFRINVVAAEGSKLGAK